MSRELAADDRASVRGSAGSECQQAAHAAIGWSGIGEAVVAALAIVDEVGDSRETDLGLGIYRY